jgi:hypothetical protein
VEKEMKALVIASVLSWSFTSVVSATSVTVSDKDAVLAGVAAETAALLLDSGLRPQNTGSGVLAVEAKGFHCDQLSNAAVDAMNARAGLPSVKCGTNSPNKRGSTAGPPFPDGRAMVDVLQKVQRAGGVAFTDCAMGYCGVFARSIRCAVDTKNADYQRGGRWTCTFTDGQ